MPDDGKPAFVLTADQVVTHPTLGILEKPLDMIEAEKFMTAYSDVPEVTTVGSVMLTHFPSMESVVRVFEATVKFDGAKLGSAMDAKPSLLERLVESGAPVMKCAGGLMIENPLVKEFITHCEGGEDAVLGLSRGSVVECLREMRERLEET